MAKFDCAPDMKTIGKRLLALLTLGALVALSPSTTAQDAPKEGAKPQRPAAQPGVRRDRVDVMAEQLKLTDDQKKQLQTIFKEDAEKMRALRQNTALSREDRQAKLKEIRDASETQVKKVLTTEQWEKWQKQQAERRTRPAGQVPAPK